MSFFLPRVGGMRATGTTGTARPTDIRFEYLRVEVKCAHAWFQNSPVVRSNYSPEVPEKSAAIKPIAGIL